MEHIPTLIYCADNSTYYAPLAIQHGWKYGACLPYKPYTDPYFADQDFKKPNRGLYMEALAKYRPVLATVLDWEKPEQYAEVMDWAEEAAQYVQEEVIIIPKVVGSVKDIPTAIGGKRIRLGYSVPTAFAKTDVPPEEFIGRETHLLGGSPQDQIQFVRENLGVPVVSVDTNYAQKVARFGKVCANNQWLQLNKIGLLPMTDVPYIAFALSCINIRNYWHGLPGVIRYGKYADHKYITEWWPADPEETECLYRGIETRSLYVALYERRIVGFVNTFEGTTLEVHPDFQYLNFKQSLLHAIPERIMEHVQN